VITYTVHEGPEPAADRLDRAEALAFVKDGFSIWAAAFTPLWMLANKLWLALVFYLSALGLVEAAFWALGIGQQPAAILMSAVHLLVGFEASSIKRWTLARHGWSMIGSVNGRNAEDCERRFFEGWLPGIPVIRPSALSGSSISGSDSPGPLTRPEAERPKPWSASRLMGAFASGSGRG